MANYEPGRYKAKVIKQGFDIERSGTDYFYMTIRPVTRDMDGYDEEVAYEGDRDVKLHLTEKSIDFQLRILRNLGWGGTELDELANGTHSFVGESIEVVCDQHEYKGKYYDRFSVYEARPEMTADTVSRLTRKFSDKLKETAKDLPKRTLTQEEIEREAQGGTDKDLPF